MKEIEDHDNNKAVRLTELGRDQSPDVETAPTDQFQKLKKPLIFGLMAIVFVGCMYLIFAPPADNADQPKAGLNEVVPQASEAGMQADKGKAYESELLEQKELEKKQALTVLSEYWNTDSTISTGTAAPGNPVTRSGGPASHQEALGSYRGIQSTLGSFYEDRGESSHLQNEIRSLKQQLAQKEAPASSPVESQLALMEKSYQMAAKYFPATAGKSEEKNPKIMDSPAQPKQHVSFAAFYPAHKSTVSSLYREPSDSALLAELSQMPERNFFTAGKTRETRQSVNSIRACIHETQTVSIDNAVRIRLLDAVKIARLVIPKGTVLTAIAKFQGNRLQLHISSIEYQGNIIPVEITAYDLDGQPGLAVPYSPERGALTEIAANMGNTAGTSISLSSTAGQQITSDLSKSVVQGISGYFSKKVRMPKITLKAGYRVFLVAKK